MKTMLTGLSSQGIIHTVAFALMLKHKGIFGCTPMLPGTEWGTLLALCMGGTQQALRLQQSGSVNHLACTFLSCGKTGSSIQGSTSSCTLHVFWGSLAF